MPCRIDSKVVCSVIWAGSHDLSISKIMATALIIRILLDGYFVGFGRTEIPPEAERNNLLFIHENFWNTKTCTLMWGTHLSAVSHTDSKSSSAVLFSSQPSRISQYLKPTFTLENENTVCFREALIITNLWCVLQRTPRLGSLSLRFDVKWVIRIFRNSEQAK